MRTTILPVLLCLLALSLAGCGDEATLPEMAGVGPIPKLPPPKETLIPTVNIAPHKGWPAGGKPTPTAGLFVAAFAAGLDHPRWLTVLPNGDVLVAESNSPAKADGGLEGMAKKVVLWLVGAGVPSPNRITLLRDADGDGIAEVKSTFLSGLNSPFGMTLVGATLYVADTDALLRFPYREGETKIDAKPEKVADLPAGPINLHWTKNVIASAGSTKLYVTVGSNSNAGEEGMENERNRAAIFEIDPATGQSRLFASGLRNPNGLAWQPDSGALWTTVNERDFLGSDLVPDYMTSLKDGGFYGWPYSYFGQHLDPRPEPQRPDLVAKGNRPGLRARRAYRIARPCLLPGQAPAGTFCRRRLHRPARVLEPQTAERLQGHFRAVRRRTALSHARGCSYRLPRCRRSCAWPPGRHRNRPSRRRARCRRRGQHYLAGDT